MFLFATLPLRNGKMCELVLPEVQHGKAFFEIAQREKKRLSQWLPWPENMLTVEDEEKFITYARGKMATEELFVLTILVDKKPVGMIDFHEIDQKNKKAEIGYWLSVDYEKQGIITESVKVLVEYAFKELGLNKISILADVKNHKSQKVPQRLQFKKEGEFADFAFYQGAFHDVVWYSLTAKEYEKVAVNWKSES